MDVRATLFGSKLRVVVASLFGVGLVVSSAFFAGVLGVPSVASIDNEFGDVNETVTTIETELVIHNPNPIGIRLGGLTVEYTASMNGIEMASGEKTGIGIGTGNSTVTLTTYLQNERIPDWWVSHVKNGERTTLVITATAHSGLLGRSVTFQTAPKTIETDIISQFNSSRDRPVNAGLVLVEDPVLVITETSATWGEVTASETPIEMTFVIHNPKSTPVAITNIGYSITMNGVLVGQGETSEMMSIPGHTTRALETQTIIQNARLDEWWVSHLQNDQTTKLRIDFYAEVEVPGTSETVRLPLDALTYTRIIETDIFGAKAASGGSGDASTSGGSGDASTSGNAGDGGEKTSADAVNHTAAGDSTTTGGESTTDNGSSTDNSSTTSDDSTVTDGSTTTDGGILGRGEWVPLQTAF